MTALVTVEEREGGRIPVQDPPSRSSHFTRFLLRRNLCVLDVARGAAPDTHRLFLGQADRGSVTHVIALSHDRTPGSAVDNERRVLQHASSVLSPEMRKTVPQILESIDVHGSLDGLAMTAVPNLVAARRSLSLPMTRGLVAAMPDWFARVWSESADGYAPVDMGRAALVVLDEMNAHHELNLGPDPVVEILRRARGRLVEFDVPRTLTHGCLCPRHVVLRGDEPGVDDWGSGLQAGDPLRDLGRFAAAAVDTRLPEVLAGRTSFAAAVRQLVAKAMRPTRVPMRLWRDVLVLGQLELAMEAHQRHDPHALMRLSNAVRALQNPNEAR